MKDRIRVSIVGATGYTGAQLLTLLATHPAVKVVAVTSRQEQNRAVAALFPGLRGYYDLVFSNPEQTNLKQSDVVFFATPHTVAMQEAGALLQAGVRVIDLSADFRLKNIAVWESWYQTRHLAAQYVESAVYGLVELNRREIAAAQLVAVPGCYPTVVSLALLPLLTGRQLAPAADIIADCKSGVSGAGRGVKVTNLYCEVADSVRAYGVAGHRHLPEIEQTLACLDPNLAGKLVFIPHLVPMVRGMEATVYVSLRTPDLDVQSLYADFYKNDYFVEVLPAGEIPETRAVKGSNKCQIALTRDYNGNRLIITAVIDNLIKGAAGQAVQAMNVMFGIEESSGLKAPPLIP